VLAHRAFGTAGRPPLLLLHGLLGSSRNWIAAGRMLSPLADVHALDLRNHGDSPGGRMDYAAMAGDVADWLAARGIDQAVVAGHSMGGKVAMRLACEQPRRVRALAVIDIAPRAYPPRWDALFAAMLALPVAGLADRAAADRALQAAAPDPELRAFLLTNLERHGTAGGFRWRIDLAALQAALPELAGKSLAPGQRYAGPVRFIRGARSDFVRTDDLAEIRAHFPRAELVTVAAAGHNLHIDNPAGLRAALEPLLAPP
jgi:pimeloyl-ACP methyl ester carboxylesterase